MIKKYKHKKCDLIVSAEKFKKGMEDRIEVRKFLGFKLKKYIVLITYPILDWIQVNKNDMIVTKENEKRVFKMVYPKKDFKNLFKKIKE